mgnify:CR=1 FL=1
MIEVTGLSKRYGTYLAVENVSFSIQKGEVVGFLGPNGAGKSTIMNILTGYLSLTQARLPSTVLTLPKIPSRQNAALAICPSCLPFTPI